MKHAWHIIILVVLVALLLGIICIGVGYMTGADMSRIVSVLDANYNLSGYYQYFSQFSAELSNVLAA